MPPEYIEIDYYEFLVGEVIFLKHTEEFKKLDELLEDLDLGDKLEVLGRIQNDYNEFFDFALEMQLEILQNSEEVH